MSRTFRLRKIAKGIKVVERAPARFRDSYWDKEAIITHMLYGDTNIAIAYSVALDKTDMIEYTASMRSKGKLGVSYATSYDNFSYRHKAVTGDSINYVNTGIQQHALVCSCEWCGVRGHPKTHNSPKYSRKTSLYDLNLVYDKNTIRHAASTTSLNRFVSSGSRLPYIRNRVRRYLREINVDINYYDEKVQ